MNGYNAGIVGLARNQSMLSILIKFIIVDK